jgi:flagellar assembly factor FliW
MQIHSSRFGQLAIQQRDIIMMPHGLIGFESSRHWVLLASGGNGAIAWLQSVAVADLAVPVISPRRFDPAYRVQVPQRDMLMLHLRPSDSMYVLTVVGLDGEVLTTNLRSPILLNATRQLAVQVITSDVQQLAMPIGRLNRPEQPAYRPQSRHAA